MQVTRWMMAIGVVVGLGLLQVSQRHAVILKGYALGERLKRVHDQETQLLWLNARVIGLRSPVHLAQAAQDQRLKLVGWSTWTPDRALAATTPLALPPMQHARLVDQERALLMHMAAVAPTADSSADDTTD